MRFELIYGGKTNAWCHAACPEAIKSPLQKGDGGRRAAEPGRVRVLHASLVPSSCDEHHKIWPSRLVSFKALHKPRCFGFLNSLKSRRGLHLPRTACVGTEGKPKTRLLGETRCRFPRPFSLREDACPQPTAPFSAATAPVRRR